MKNTNRFIALALCFTLTLGVFAYRPSEAKAIAGVDDAVVIGALLSAFAGGCGLIFSNNGMTSSELAQGLTDKWNEFNESAESGASSFAAWLGFEDTSALLGALSFSGGNLTIPRAVAKKLAEFTNWLVQDTGVSAGDKKNLLTGQTSFLLENGSAVGVGEYRAYGDYNLSSLLSKGGVWTFSCGMVIDNSTDGSFSFSYPDREKPNIVRTGTVNGCIGRVGLLSAGSNVYFVFERSDGWIVSYPALSAYFYSRCDLLRSSPPNIPCTYSAFRPFR